MDLTTEPVSIAEPKLCRFCGYHNVTDEFVYTCPCCDRESCPDCAGRCGCDVEDDDTEPEA